MPTALPSVDLDVRRRATRLLVAGTVAVGLLDTIQYQLGNELRGDGGHILQNAGGQLIPWLWLAALIPGVVRMAERCPIDGGAWRRSLGPQLIGMTIFALLHVTGAILVTWAFARMPVNVTSMATKHLLYRFPIDSLTYWGAVAVAHAVRAVAIAREREQAAARLEATLAEIKLAALRDRLNPHFVFNTLNAVTTLALREDHAGVIRTVAALSDLLRVTLAERKGQEATLAEELTFLDRYLEIERLRLGERVEFARTVDPSLMGALVPVMLIQPLVENAVLHGAAVKPGPVRIEVRIEHLGDALRIEVADTGPGFGSPRAGNGTGIGLASSKARLAALYGPKGTLETANQPAGGAVVRVTLPIRFRTVVTPI